MTQHRDYELVWVDRCRVWANWADDLLREFHLPPSGSAYTEERAREIIGHLARRGIGGPKP